MSRKINIIIEREFNTRVRKKSFLIMTFLMPVLFIGIMFVPALIAMYGGQTHETVAVIDKTGKYLASLPSNKDFTFVTADKTLEQYKEIGGEKSKVSAVLFIKGDLLAGDSLALNSSAIAIYSYKQMPSGLADYVNEKLSQRLSDERIDSHNIPYLKEIIRDSSVKIKVPTFKWSEKGEAERSSGKFAGMIGMMLTVISYIFIMMYGGFVLQGVLEEKKSRIMEVMVSSVKPFDLMAGKIIGIGLVGLLQMTLWAILTGIIVVVGQLVFIGGVYDASALAQMQTGQLGGLSAGMSMGDLSEMNEMMGIIAGINFTKIFLTFVVYFIGGYLLYSSLFAALASAVSSDEDTNQFLMPVTIVMLFAFYAALGSMNNPNGGLAFWCSLIPFTSPVVMMVRLPYDVPLWQELLSIVVLYTSSIGITWIAAKIYRVGILMYGKKPTFKELWRWTRYR